MRAVTGWVCAAGMLALLASCGGGGGGGGTSDMGNGSAGGGGSTEQPTYLVLGESGQSLTARTIALGAHALALGQWAVDVAQRMTHPGAPPALQTRCITGGTLPAGQLSITLDDRNGDGRVSVGDSISVVMQDCVAQTLFAPASGSFRIEIQPGTSAALDGAVLLRVSTQDLVLQGEEGGIAPARLAGAMDVSWQEDTVSQALRVSTIGDEELAFLAQRGPNNLRPDRVRRLDMTRRSDFAAAETQTSMAFVTEASNGGGTLAVSTPQLLKGPLSQTLTSGQVRIQGLEGHVLADANGSGFSYRLFNTNLNAVARQGTISPLMSNRVLAWNGHSHLAERVGLYGETSVWLEFDPASFNCAGIVGCQADAASDRVFLHPVLPQPMVASAQATFRVQVGGALAEAQPGVEFVFVDCSVDGYAYSYWNVPGTFERHGALFNVRPQERLRQGRRYRLEAREPADPQAVGSIRLANGSTMRLTLPSFCVTMPRDLLVELQNDGMAVTSPGESVTLRSQVTLARGQAASRYRWEQLSGAPVALGTPDAPITTVAYDGTAPRLVDEPLLQLTVSDTLGNEQRTRFQVRVGDHVASGPYAYAAARSADGTEQRNLWASSRPEAWNWGPASAQGYLDFPTGSATFATADGAPLAVGRYAGALPSDVAGTHPVIAPLYSGNCLVPMDAWFEILEMERDASGTPTRLSLDYEINCDQPRDLSVATRYIGSYRFNSVVPVRR